MWVRNRKSAIENRQYNMNWVSYDFKRQKAGAPGEVLDRITYPCGFCKGTGIPPSKKSGACPVCAGKGTVDVGPRAVVCAYCRGAGTSILNRSLSCPVCRGKGVVQVTGRTISACAACRGSGRAGATRLPCTACHGVGVKMQ